MNRNKNLLTILRVTLFAFLVNALLPFFASYPSSEAKASKMPSIFADKILICTSDGFKWVSLEDLENETNLPASHSKYKCVLCFISSKENKNFVPVEFTLAYALFFEEKYSKFYESTTIKNQSFYQIALSRAPPFSS